MKKFIFSLLALLFLTAPGFAQEEEAPRNPPLIEIDFGRPSKDCTGFGICKLKFNITTQDVVTLITVFINPAGLLTLKMPPEFYKNNAKSFQNGYLVIDEPYQLDITTSRAIGVADGYKINTGRYKVVYDRSTNTYNCTL